MMTRTTAAAALVLLLAACAAPSPEQDADSHPQKIYRTGSNLPVKDYGAENIETGKPDAANSMQRPGASVLGRKPGG